MTIYGSTNNVSWTYKLEVTEIATSVIDRTSTLQVKVYLGRASSTSYIGGNYSNTINITGTQSQTQNGNIPYPTYINAGSWYELNTFTFVVPNNDNPTIINISSTMSSGDFTPSYAIARGNMQLTILHLNPEILTAEIVETNQDMIDLGVPNTTIVQYLSEKTITLRVTTKDDAIPSYRLEHYSTNYVLPLPPNEYQSSSVFNTDYTQNNVVITDGKAKIVQKIKDSMNGTNEAWLFVVIDSQITEPDGIAYTKPIIERASTSIKRKSGSYSATLQRTANLTDNLVSLNLKGNIYNTNDIIGNNNSITEIGYKIWEVGTSEPASYTQINTLPTPDSNGDFTISDFEITNINFTKVYNYKIIVTDNYNYFDTITDGKISTGQSLWSEYKDHVDFLALTVKGYNPFEYNEDNEIIVGIYNDGNTEKPIYRKIIKDTLISNNITIQNSYIRKVYGFVQSRYNQWWPMPGIYSDSGYNNFFYLNADRNTITIDYNSYYDTSCQYEIVVEYTKTTD